LSVVTVKVSDEIKKDMEKRKKRINWAEEIRQFISNKIEEGQRRQNIEKADKLLQKSRKLPKGTAARLVREDRDSHN